MLTLKFVQAAASEALLSVIQVGNCYEVFNSTKSVIAHSLEEAMQFIGLSWS